MNGLDGWADQAARIVPGEPAPLALAAAGFYSQPDAYAEVRETASGPHEGPGSRSLRVTMAGGVSVEVLPACGLDLGSLWFDNQPYAWRSPLGPRGAAIDPGGEGWLGGFVGGALVTCGVDNIGPARDGVGMHGSHHATPARDVAVLRDGDGAVVITGEIDSSRVFGRHVVVRRTVRVALGEPLVEVCDVVENRGTTPAAAPLLYHVNFGAPLVAPGTAVSVLARRTTPRDDASRAFDAAEYPAPTERVVEAVWEHGGLAADANGKAMARVEAPSGRWAQVQWRVGELDRCLQWVYPTRGGWALGIEPANAPLFGQERDAPHVGAPVLEPGESLSGGVSIRCGAPDASF